MSWEVKSCMFTRDKSIIKSFKDSTIEKNSIPCCSLISKSTNMCLELFCLELFSLNCAWTLHNFSPGSSKMTFTGESFIMDRSYHGLKLCRLLVDYCDVFISCLDSYSDGTHSLQQIFIIGWILYAYILAWQLCSRWKRNVRFFKFSPFYKNIQWILERHW